MWREKADAPVPDGDAFIALLHIPAIARVLAFRRTSLRNATGSGEAPRGILGQIIRIALAETRIRGWWAEAHELLIRHALVPYFRVPFETRILAFRRTSLRSAACGGEAPLDIFRETVGVACAELRVVGDIAGAYERIVLHALPPAVPIAFGAYVLTLRQCVAYPRKSARPIAGKIFIVSRAEVRICRRVPRTFVFGRRIGDIHRFVAADIHGGVFVGVDEEIVLSRERVLKRPGRLRVWDVDEDRAAKLHSPAIAHRTDALVDGAVKKMVLGIEHGAYARRDPRECKAPSRINLTAPSTRA